VNAKSQAIAASPVVELHAVMASLGAELGAVTASFSVWPRRTIISQYYHTVCALSGRVGSWILRSSLLTVQFARDALYRLYDATACPLRGEAIQQQTWK
jgi:hypothetical protein